MDVIADLHSRAKAATTLIVYQQRCNIIVIYEYVHTLSCPPAQLMRRCLDVRAEVQKRRRMIIVGIINSYIETETGN